MGGLHDKRLIFVTGKGGVGKSTVALALGLAAGRRGLRTIVVEVASQDRVSRALGHEGPGEFKEVELADDLYGISIDPERSLTEYLQLQVRVKAFADVLTSSRMFHYFAAATPGMAEMVTMGKIWELAQLQRRTRGASRYDLVIVDAPATGHGVALMRTPRTFADIARVGPVANQAGTIHEMVSDPARTAVVAVALPEEIPVNETLVLRDKLDEELGLGVAQVVLNAVYPDRFADDEVATLNGALDRDPPPGVRAALQAALSEHARSRAQTEQRARLAEGMESEPLELPFLFVDDIERPQYELLSELLESTL